MGEMVDRVARVIGNEMAKPYDTGSPFCIAILSDDQARRIAIAVLKAMREHLIGVKSSGLSLYGGIVEITEALEEK